MRKLWGNIGGALLLVGVPVGWLISLPSNLEAWGAVIDTMLNDPWVTIPAVSGAVIIAFTNIPKLRFWEAKAQIALDRLDRISMVDFLRLSESVGWTIVEPGSCILDLTAKFNQAAADGVFAVWGRVVTNNQITELTRDERLIPIPKEHWYEYKFDWVSAVNLDKPTLKIKSISDENLWARTQSPNQNFKMGFADLHLDRVSSEVWIRNIEVTPKFVSLSNAASQLYTEARKTNQLAAAASEWGDSDEETLNWWGGYIAVTKKISLFGMRPPSNEFEEIDRKEIESMHIEDGAEKLTSNYNKGNRYTDLKILSEDFRPLLDELKEKTE